MAHIIAERRFVVLGRPDTEVRARIFAPAQIPSKHHLGFDTFQCRYAVEINGESSEREARGADSLQALLGAIKMLNADLVMHRNEDFNGQLIWEGMDDPGTLGLPEES